MRAVLVCGGRDYQNQMLVFKTLSDLHATEPIDLIIHGGAEGADSLAGSWAGRSQVNCLRVPAKWNKHGKAAGAMRNSEMLAFCQDHGVPVEVIAFPGGVGTANMKDRARRCAARVVEVGP